MSIPDSATLAVLLMTRGMEVGRSYIYEQGQVYMLTPGLFIVDIPRGKFSFRRPGSAAVAFCKWAWARPSFAKTRENLLKSLLQ